MLSLHHFEAVKSGRLNPPAWMKACRSDIPAGKAGPWRIEKQEIGLDLQNLRLMRDGRGCFPGTYTILYRGNTVVMSDTTAELADIYDIYRLATGRVLIHGLGLGCVLKAVLSKSDVTHVDVVEIAADLIELVGKHFNDPRIRIHHADCKKKRWGPRVCWDVVWHDIWDGICSDNVKEMDALERRFEKRCDWQGCWSREQAEALC